ncbi:MAG TPA: asparagine synthase (glutamine-hydrolyzing) [Acidobacteriota bacterium]|jgi:asparagine synthase (glutamine-hydrolysing)
MCGICGKLTFDKGAVVERSLLKLMLDTIRHRGPDDEGVYVAPGVGLGHRRLAIIDLNSGRQPLSNEDGTVWIVFNGEIYNYQELRRYLMTKGHVFKTQSDTEVIVHLYEELGEACVEKLRGMFAFALWDERQTALLLARDRVGIKPLYYSLTNRSLIFASEIKALLADPEVKREVVPNMIDRFLTFYYVPGEETLFQNIYKLAAGSYMVFRGGKPEIRQYWDLHFEPSRQNLRQAETELSELLDEAVKLHMISDVPVGFLLSGGVDSTAMLSLAAGKTDRPISSFTIGFSAPGITDERPYAKLAARRYRSQHHQMTITAKDFQDFLPQYVWHMEEPVCEPPAVALYYVSRLARNFVKVLISGEGGDEAFAGYSNYRTILWLERLKSVLRPFNRVLAPGVSFLNHYFLRSKRVAKYAPLLNTPFKSYYYSRTSNPYRFFNSRMDELYSKDFAECVDKERSASAATKYLVNGAQGNRLNTMLYVDTKTWLVDDLLLKADKMTMANSVELRVPLLDHKVLEFAASLPENFKIRRFTTKYIAKRILNHRVPKEILNRRKAGFPVPYESWLRTDLRDWLLDILLDRKTIARGYFKKKCIEELVSEDLRSGSYSKEIFSLAVLELWHRVFLDKEAAPVP